MSKTEETILDFLHQSEGLKNLLRHSWLSSGRRESVAEHTWRMALMAFLFSSYLDKKVDVLKVLKIILVHDLVEIYSHDFPAFKKQPTNKSELERKSIIRLTKSLPQVLKKEVVSLWEEYDTNKTKEARFAKALDKLEVLIQHTEAPIESWTKKEITFNLYHGIEYCEYDSFLRAFRELVNKDTLKYYKKNKLNKELYINLFKPRAKA